MSGIARRRLLRDFQKLKTESPHGVIGCPIESDIMRWSAVIFGPEESPWEGGTFQLELSFSDDYPNKPPTVRFVTRVFHPNVYMDGSICLDILQHRWSPIYDISAILTSIQSLLTDPNPNSPANSEAARLYSENRREYNRRVQFCASDSLKTIKALEVSPRSGTDDDSSAAPPANEDSGTAPEAQSPATVARAEDTEG
eukprot:Polyplicarium_translucidae@DN2535_c0_g1_i2.p1